MRGWRFFHTFVVAGWLLWIGSARGQDVVSKRRIAVLNFDSPSAEPGSPSGPSGTAGEDVGKGISVQLIQKLVQGGKYTIVDRSALERLLKEQKDTDSGSVDAYGLAARIGRLLGLDAMIIGAVTRYGPDDKSKSASGGAFHSGVRTRQSKAFVEITAKVFSVGTGEVTAGFSCTGESEYSGTITTFGGRGPSKPAVDVLGSEFVGSLFGEATRNAVEQAATQLNSIADKIPVLRLSLEGLVAEVDKNLLTLNIGRKAGVNVGDQFEVVRSAKAPPGSASVDVPQPMAEHIGWATATEVADDYSIAEFSGAAPAQVGDRVRGRVKLGSKPH